MKWVQAEWQGVQGVWLATCERFHGRVFLVALAGPWATPLGYTGGTGWLPFVVDLARSGEWNVSRSMLLGTAEPNRGAAQAVAEAWSVSGWADAEDLEPRAEVVPFTLDGEDTT